MNLKLGFIILLFTISFSNKVYSQQDYLEYEEIKNINGINIKNTKPDKALIVINSEIPLTIEASNDNINSDNLIIDNNIYYYYYAEPPTQTVTLISQGFVEASVTLQNLKAKDIRYFKVKNKPLHIKYLSAYKEITDSLKTKDVAAYGNDALIVLYSERSIEINSTIKIDKKEQNGEQYSIFLKQVPQTLTIKSSSSKDVNIEFKELKKDNPRYFKIIYTSEQIEKSETYNENIKPGDYEIITDPPGAKIELRDKYGYEDKEFNEKDRLSPYVLHKQGIYIMKLMYPEYDIRIDTIKFGEKKNTAKYKLIPKFSHIVIEKSPSNAETFINNKPLEYYQNDKSGIKVEKGLRKILIKAEHYYNLDTTIFTEPFKTHKIKKNLKPKIGSLTLKPGKNAENAIVSIDNEKAGTLPITKYKLQEGEHYLKIEKKGYLIFEKQITIDENKTTEETIELMTSKETLIYTEPEGANIYIDGNKVGTSNLNTKLEVGKHNIKIEKEDFKSRIDEIEINSNYKDKQTFTYTLVPTKCEINIKTEPEGALVSIDGTEAKSSNLKIKLDVGKHTLRIEKEQFQTKTYNIEVYPTFKEIQTYSYTLLPLKFEFKIITEPSGAEIYIDYDKTGTSDLNTKISIGSHTIRIEKPHYETQTVTINVSPDQIEKKILTYYLKPLKYSVTFESKPKYATIYVDDNLLGETPNTFPIEYGRHKIRFTKENQVSRTKNIYVTGQDKIYKSKLISSSNCFYIGGSGGSGLWTADAGYFFKRILIEAGFLVNNSSSYTSKYPIKVRNANIYDINQYDNIDKDSYDTDSVSTYSGNVKIGYLFQKPVPFILTVGYAGYYSDWYKNVFQAKHQYISSDGKTKIEKGDYFTDSKEYRKGYNCLTFGIMLPILRHLYVTINYYSGTQNGNGLLYGAGLLIDVNKK